MCRHIGYLGRSRALATFLDAPHGLREQGRAPREMVVAKDNPDGWGVAWWEHRDAAPRHYRTTTKMWEDDAFADAHHCATAALAAVRKASPDTTLQSVNNAPFVADTRAGHLAFSLNGYAFHDGGARRLHDALAPETRLDGDTDTEVLFALLCARVDAGAAPSAALAAVHHVVDPSAGAYVNLMVVGADEIAATTWHHTLYVQRTDDATTIASEALDADPAWQRVPDASLLVADRTGVTITDLEGLR